jgi:hypothetical protein
VSGFSEKCKLDFTLNSVGGVYFWSIGFLQTLQQAYLNLVIHRDVIHLKIFLLPKQPISTADISFHHFLGLLSTYVFPSLISTSFCEKDNYHYFFSVSKAVYCQCSTIPPPLSSFFLVLHFSVPQLLCSLTNGPASSIYFFFPKQSISTTVNFFHSFLDLSPTNIFYHLFKHLLQTTMLVNYFNYSSRRYLFILRMEWDCRRMTC